MHMNLSASARSALLASVELSRWIDGEHPKTRGNSDNAISAAFYAIALDHREAILLLLRHGARSAAFALVRSVYEAWIKAVWAHTSATPSELQRISSAEAGAMPKLETMIRRLDSLPDSKQIFSAIKRIEWGPMSDYAHGDQRQVSRWIDETGIGSTHSDDETEDVLRILDVYAVLCCSGLLTLAGRPNLHVLEKFEELANRFAEADRTRQP